MKGIRKVDLLNGSIGINLFKLSLPIVLTSLVSIIYNLTDIKFISMYVGDKGVASAAAATFFIVLAMALLMIPKNGAQILVAQSIGAKQYKTARKYARVSLIITVFSSVFVTIIILLFAPSLINMVGVKDIRYLDASINFLRIVSLGFVFLFLLNTISAIINGVGDTFGPFIFNSIGVMLNVFLDYLLLGVFSLGVEGAALATVLAQAIAAIGMYFYMRKPGSRFRKMRIFKVDEWYYYNKIIKLGFPSGISQALFTIISIFIAQKISTIDEAILGVQRLGIQFEAFTWNIGGGMASAVATFIGQNFGAKKYERINEIYKVSLMSISSITVVITFVFIFGSRYLFTMFFEDPRLIQHGVNYLTILSFSQILSGIEILTTGAFNGIGRTKEPTIIAVIGTGLRVPIIHFIAPYFGINAIWWTITGTSILKGIVSFVLFVLIWKNYYEYVKITNVIENKNIRPM